MLVSVEGLGRRINREHVDWFECRYCERRGCPTCSEGEGAVGAGPTQVLFGRNQPARLLHSAKVASVRRWSASLEGDAWLICARPSKYWLSNRLLVREERGVVSSPLPSLQPARFASGMFATFEATISVIVLNAVQERFDCFCSSLSGRWV